ncbi:MAG: hypothetical protein WD119_01075 [Pirellulaceae bacterium]
MSTRIRWTYSVSLSVLRAAASVAFHEPVISPPLESSLSPSVAAINNRLALDELDLARFWQELVASGLDEIDDRERCESALLAAGCSPLASDTLASAVSRYLTDIRLAHSEEFPKLADQLPLRGRPIRERWEERGAGLLRQIGARTHSQLLPTRATVCLIQPVRGGDGGVDVQRESVWMEAVLTNVEPNIPETLRLGWLLARLGMTHENANRLIAADNLPRVASCALVPVVLAAGQELELIPPGPLPIAAALQTWRMEADASTEAVLRNWWEQLSEGGTPFPVAIKALDRMLAH